MDISDLDKAEDLYKKKFFCPFPFKYVYGEQDGRWKLCSEALPSGYSSDDMSIEEWFTSDYIDNIRREMLKDDPDLDMLSKSCKRCVESEKNLGNSTRTNLLKLDSWKPGIQNANLFEQTDQYWFYNRPLVVQMRMFKNNDICNLGCYMCFPKFSTIRQQDLTKIPNQKLIEGFQDINKSSKVLQVSRIQEVIDVIEHISIIELIGGEPLYVKECFDFVDRLTKEVDCSEISLSVFTNLSILHNKKKNFLEYRKYFNNIEFKVSMDGIGKYNEYIRRKSVFEDLESNVKQVLNNSDCDIFIWTTISMLSILRFEEVESWCEKNGIHYEYNILKDPKMLSIVNLPDPIKEDLIKRFSHIEDFVSALKSPRREDLFQKAMKYIISLDEIYNTNVFEVYPELEEFVS